MSNTNPQKELEVFLAALPMWLRKALEQCKSTKFTSADPKEWRAFRDYVDDKLQRYENLLRRIPTKWKAYRKKHREQYGSPATQIMLPRNPAGAPRKDAIASEAIRLRKEGKSYAQIARKLKRKKDATRKLVKSRESNKD